MSPLRRAEPSRCSFSRPVSGLGHGVGCTACGGGVVVVGEDLPYTRGCCVHVVVLFPCLSGPCMTLVSPLCRQGKWFPHNTFTKKNDIQKNTRRAQQCRFPNIATPPTKACGNGDHADLRQHYQLCCKVVPHRWRCIVQFTRL